MQLMSHSSSDESAKASLDFDNIHVLDQFAASDKNRWIALNWLTVLNTSCTILYYYYNCNNNK